MANRPLPPLPPSDGDSLIRNRAARNFWGDAEIIRINDTPAPKCDHEFINTKGGVRCTKCNFGLLGGQLEAKDGQVFVQGKPINFPK